MPAKSLKIGRERAACDLRKAALAVAYRLHLGSRTRSRCFGHLSRGHKIYGRVRQRLNRSTSSLVYLFQINFRHSIARQALWGPASKSGWLPSAMGSMSCQLQARTAAVGTFKNCYDHSLPVMEGGAVMGFLVDSCDASHAVLNSAYSRGSAPSPSPLISPHLYRSSTFVSSRQLGRYSYCINPPSSITVPGEALSQPTKIAVALSQFTAAQGAETLHNSSHGVLIRSAFNSTASLAHIRARLPSTKCSPYHHQPPESHELPSLRFALGSGCHSPMVRC